MRTLELVRYEDLSPYVRSFECRAVADALSFEAGQYLSIEFELDGVAYSRPYSIASPPDGRRVEILARNNPGGAGTRFLWGLQRGSRLSVDGPHGSFVLRRPEPRDSLFIANGTGIAPIRSMLGAALACPGRPRLTLLYGVRDQSDLVYHDELSDLARRHPNFSYEVVLSRPLDGWTGRSGRVQDHVAAALGGNAAIDAYVSGSPEMVADIRVILRTLGLAADAIRFEQ